MSASMLTEEPGGVLVEDVMSSFLWSQSTILRKGHAALDKVLQMMRVQVYITFTHTMVLRDYCLDPEGEAQGRGHSYRYNPDVTMYNSFIPQLQCGLVK